MLPQAAQRGDHRGAQLNISAPFIARPVAPTLALAIWLAHRLQCDNQNHVSGCVSRHRAFAMPSGSTPTFAHHAASSPHR